MKNHIDTEGLFIKTVLIGGILGPIIIVIYLVYLWNQMEAEQAQRDAEWKRRHHTTYYYSTPKTSSGSSNTSSSKGTSTRKSTGSKIKSNNGYDDGYDDVYDNDDYDWDRYLNDDDYALGVDDAMDELDW